jgi:putative membrane-bound dehydrogenase-like protein
MTTRHSLVGLSLLVFSALGLVPVSSFAAEDNLLHSFERRQLSSEFTSEGATAADIDRDGQVDVIAGPYWYAGPAFTERHEITPTRSFSIEEYSESFLHWSYDFDGDGWLDVLTVGFPGKQAFWYENPSDRKTHWRQHLALPVVDNESPTFEDVTGDGRPELISHLEGRLGYSEFDPADPTRQWQFTPISPNRGYEMFNHGLGVGDVDGDGRADLLERQGWWRQPADVAKGSDWEFHPFEFTPIGGAQMYAYDFDGDGDNDVVTSKAAHAYGLSWFENTKPGDRIEFQEHVITGEKPEQNDYGVAFSQLHAVALVDIDRDGVRDIVTGKRYWAHSSHDPGSLEPVVSYWFRTVREEGKVHFVPYVIDNGSGVGTQVCVTDINNDDWPDVVVGNKKGTFALLHQTKPVDRATWAAAQPKLLSAPKADATRTEAVKEDPTAEDQVQAPAASQPEDGFPAQDASGHTVNLDFEAGDARDWTATGAAFDRQPIWGDTVLPRRPGSISGHRGDRWVGTYEIAGDAPQGTFTSTSFRVTHPWASLMIGGGSQRTTRVEIVLAETQEVVFSTSGQDAEQLQPVVADLTKHVGEDAFLRIVDESSEPWGHINYDHFRFWDARPQFSPLDSTVLRADEYPHSGLTAEESLAAMTLPEGFKASVFASEPDVKQPIAMALDDRGRVWVAEAYEYPTRAPDGKGRDRLLIFEDTNGDGRFDSRKVFAEGLNLVSGLEVGFGGAWVGAAPYLLFIPDKNGDDLADGPPEVLLDGWGYQDTHETLNTFSWGPDGWLYGCHGVFTHSRVGKPGAPDRDRTPINAGVWRYHPTRRQFEVFAQGTSNPWGVDFDDHGQAVVTACVIPHLFHMIQGGRYQRQAGEHFNPYTYGDITTIADHLHYLGDTPHSGNLKSDEAGGGHAHAGAMFYLGGAWPEEYRNRILMNNIHGQRLNSDILAPRGSGLVGSHGPDFLLTGDRASQMLTFRYGPDGQVYIIDWYDMQACHNPNASAHDRSNGRIYKVSYGDAKPVTVDLAKSTDVELADATLNHNDWYVRHARRILQERATQREIDPAAISRLRGILADNSDDTRRLRALWALHAIGASDDAFTQALLKDVSPYVRGWAVQLAVESRTPDAQLIKTFVELAKHDDSQVVRLYLASALQRIPAESRWEILAGLASHPEDGQDHNLPLMVWYAAEPLASVDAARALNFGLSCGQTLPLVRKFMFRRVASADSPQSLAMLVETLGKSTDRGERLEILGALRQAFAGRRHVDPPAAWQGVYQTLEQTKDAELHNQATALGLLFGDAGALAASRAMIASAAVDAEARRDALAALLAVNDPQLAGTLQSLLADAAMRDVALNGLAQYDDPATPTAVLAIYNELKPEEKLKAISTLASRAPYALALLQAIEGGQIPKTDLSADLVRQIDNLKDKDISTRLTSIWGRVRNTPTDKLKLIETYRQLLATPAASQADPELGRAVFARTCQQCHTLYGVGSNIGPDLTGSNRADAEYLLSNIVDPSALISKEYLTTDIMTDSGRTLTGIVSAEDDKSVTLRSTTETLVVPKNEIEVRSLTELSMMPENQLAQFSEQETLALFAYLRGKSQVHIQASAANTGSLFNTRDLTGWRGDKTLWSVENGEIVGRTEGLAHNSFLLSDLSAEDFHLTVEVLLKDNAGNSGIQFRSQPLNGFEEVAGYQADIGADWWGKLYEEHGRELLWKVPGDKYVRPGEWNTYEIRAAGSHIQTWINGHPCVDLDDPSGKRRGIFALQLHSGGPTEVRYKNLRLDIGRAHQIQEGSDPKIRTQPAPVSQ